MNTSLDQSHKTFIDNLIEARNFRMHQERLDNASFSGMTVLSPHPIVSKRAIKERELT